MRLADHPGNRIPTVCVGLAETMAAHFLGNESVAFRKVLQSHQVATLQPAEVMVANKGYDSERIRERIEAGGITVVTQRRRNTVKGNAGLNRSLYRYWRLLENAFARLKHY